MHDMTVYIVIAIGFIVIIMYVIAREKMLTRLIQQEARLSRQYTDDKTELNRKIFVETTEQQKSIGQYRNLEFIDLDKRIRKLEQLHKEDMERCNCDCESED